MCNWNLKFQNMNLSVGFWTDSCSTLDKITYIRWHSAWSLLLLEHSLWASYHHAENGKCLYSANPVANNLNEVAALNFSSAPPHTQNKFSLFSISSELHRFVRKKLFTTRSADYLWVTGSWFLERDIAVEFFKWVAFSAIIFERRHPYSRYR